MIVTHAPRSSQKKAIVVGIIIAVVAIIGLVFILVPDAGAAFRQFWNNSQLLNTILTVLGVALLLFSLLAWYLSNRAEALPNPEQREQLRDFVANDFATLVARRLQPLDDGGASVIARGISTDRDWSKFFLHCLTLHQELNHVSRVEALKAYRANIDTAVRQQAAALREPVAAR